MKHVKAFENYESVSTTSYDIDDYILVQKYNKEVFPAKIIDVDPNDTFSKYTILDVKGHTLYVPQRRILKKLTPAEIDEFKQKSISQQLLAKTYARPPVYSYDESIKHKTK